MGSLTQEQKSLVMGSLLGDGYLRIMPGRKNAFFEFNHSIKQKDYVDWKFKKLQGLVKSPPKEHKGNDGRVAYRFFTKQDPYFTELYKRFYKDKKKVVPEIKFDAIVLAVWFMDDGSKSHNSYYINTQQFYQISQEKLMSMLKIQCGIENTLNRDKQYYRIRIKQKSTQMLKSLIAGYVIPSMMYKL